MNFAVVGLESLGAGFWFLLPWHRVAETTEALPVQDRSKFFPLMFFIW